MKKTNFFKFAALTAVLAVAGMFANAQVTTPTIAKQAPTNLGQVSTPTIPGGSIKVIDNKGTIKYLQVQNGITQVTNTNITDGGIVTTWQLGGTLVEDTYIDVDGNIFGLNGIQLVDTAALKPSTDATNESDAGTGTGWTLLVRNEVTGAIMKLKASDLITSGHQIYTVAATPLTTYTVTGMNLQSFKTLYVYRNGAKLLAGSDYTVSNAVVTIVTSVDLPLYEGDKIEIHFIK